MRTSDGWVSWRAGSRPPERFEAPDSVLARAARFRPVAPGVERADLSLQGPAGMWRVGVVLVRLDPALLDFEVVVPPGRADGFSGRWRVDEAPPEAVFAVNAGQFTGGPWGWLVQGGRLRQPPGSGALAPGVAFLSGGGVALLPPDSLVGAEGVHEGFQSYPTLLEGEARVPEALRRDGGGVDRSHRDGRLALGLLPDGRILVALTRFEGVGGLLEVVPFGPTTPEMAALMGGLGCTRAVLLDGGISGQLLVAEAGERRVWPGLRAVAAGLVARPRTGAGGR